MKQSNGGKQIEGPSHHGISSARLASRLGKLGERSIAVHSMKQALTLSSNVARVD